MREQLEWTKMVFVLNKVKCGQNIIIFWPDRKESVNCGRVIGKFYDIKTGQYLDTTRMTIHYDSKGMAHIVPANPMGD